MSDEERDFYVTQRQIGEQSWHVLARSKAEAIRLVKEGQGEPVSFEIVSVQASLRVDEEGEKR